MKILVSAYACSPYLGSEPGVGWAAVTRIAAHHEVFVLTGSTNRADVEKAQNEKIVPPRVQFRFIEETAEFNRNRFVARFQNWMRYRTFNKKVLQAANQWHTEIQFDLCHQVTIAAWRMPSPLWQLPVPFIWGPIGGAGEIPICFRGMLSKSARAFEYIRDFNTFIAQRSKPFRNCMAHTAVVFAANDETIEFLRPYRNDRPLIKLPIASISAEKAIRFRRPETLRPTEPIQLFAGGNIEGRKGVSLALHAIARAKKMGVNVRYVVAGGGPDIPNLLKLKKTLNLDHEVEFHSGYSGAEYIKALHQAHIYFLPSFRESTPVTLLEACLAGCYPIVANTSAQGEIVKRVGGSAVDVKSVDALINGLSEALIWYAKNSAEAQNIADAAGRAVADEFSTLKYDNAIINAYQSINRKKSLE